MQQQIRQTGQGFARNAIAKANVVAPVIPRSFGTRSVRVFSGKHAAPHMRARQLCSRTAVRVQAHHSGANVRHGAVVARQEQRFGVVVGRFNDLVTKLLLEGALGAFQTHGADMKNVEVCWVPGSFELPVVAKAMAKSGKFDAVICIGVVVRGATTHYDAVVSAATSGVLNAGVDTGVPTVFGVLTCDTMEQALDRAGGKVGNKGGEAAITAIEMANLMADLRKEGLAAPAWIAK